MKRLEYFFQVFQDLDETFVVEDDAIQATDKLGQGAFGTVSKGILKRVIIIPVLRF